VNLETAFYYLGYAIALFLCRGLGRLFFIPMLINMGFDVAVQFNLLAGWDIRWVTVGYGLLFFIWVATLAKAFDTATVVVLIVVDIFTAYWGILPNIQSAGSGTQFWNATSTSIVNVWLVSILIVSMSAILKGSFGSTIQRGYSELLIIPKRRFLIPIAMWAAVIVLPEFLGNKAPEFIHQNRFKIAGQLLVWGWVAIELPFFIMYKRLRSNGD